MCSGDRTVLVHDTGYCVKALLLFPAFAVDAEGKEAKQSRLRMRKALKSA